MPRKRPKSTRGRGRPYLGTALYERADLAGWFEEVAEKHRQAGSKKPYLDALLDFIELEYGEAGAELEYGEEEAAAIIRDEKRFERERRRLKKKRRKGRQEWLWLKEWAERMNQLSGPDPVPVEEEPVEEARPFRKRPPKYPK